jgi:hypothetical protein
MHMAKLRWESRSAEVAIRSRHAEAVYDRPQR